MPKSLAWIFQEFPSRGISTRDSYFIHFFGRTFDYFKEKSWEENGQFGSNLTDGSTTPCPVACVAGLIVMPGVLSWRRSHELTSTQSSRGAGAKKQQYPPLIPPAVQGTCPEVNKQKNTEIYATVIPLSQCSPWKLAVHWQVRLSPFGEHVAPFLQGLLNLQASIKFKNCYILSQEPCQFFFKRFNLNVVKNGRDNI